MRGEYQEGKLLLFTSGVSFERVSEDVIEKDEAGSEYTYLLPYILKRLHTWQSGRSVN